MKPFTGSESEDASSVPFPEPQKRRMEKAQVQTTKYGTQYVNVLDVIQSDEGWAEIQRIKEADLVPSCSENGANKSSPSHEK